MIGEKALICAHQTVLLQSGLVHTTPSRHLFPDCAPAVSNAGRLEGAGIVFQGIDGLIRGMSSSIFEGKYEDTRHHRV